MRIICPSCLAEYEVQDTAIPQSGRDVQCSNCGHAWFQPGPALALREESAEDDLPETDAAPADGDGLEPDGEAGSRQDPGLADAEPPAGQDDDGSVPEDDEPQDDLQPRKIDEAVLRVLREEAEREARARRAEAGVIETQPELGLEQGAPRRPERPRRQIIGDTATTRPRPAKRERDSGRERRPESAPPDEIHQAQAVPPAGVASGRSRLPDIEEVSPTLRGASSADQPDFDEIEEVRQRGRFRTGFLAVLVLAALALLVYALTPQIVALVPAAEPVLSPFAEAMDRARLWLSETVDAALRAILARLT